MYYINDEFVTGQLNKEDCTNIALIWVVCGMVVIEHSYGRDANTEDKDMGGGKRCSIHV
jgi:hypothetical protein